MASEMKALQYSPFNSHLHPGFWSVFSKLKLEVLGLKEDPVTMTGQFVNNGAKNLPTSMNVEWNAFQDNVKLPWNTFKSIGTLINKNTLDAFKQCDKGSIMEVEAGKLQEAFYSGEALKNPDVLNRFVILMYADLKKYVFYYWFAFPAVTLPDEVFLAKEPAQLSSKYSPAACDSLSAKYSDLKEQHPSQASFFGAVISDDSTVLVTLKEALTIREDAVLCFADPSTMESNPGWPLRNLLALSFYVRPGKSFRVICIRQTVVAGGKTNAGSSLVLEVIAPKDIKFNGPLKCVGWEKNQKSQLAPRIANMKSSMSPESLAESSVDLNLKLMKWRLVPDLDLEKISSTRCLLLGSGTLGCNVARALLGWGVRNITFIDNGKVSYSNPVRQSLFAFSDCLEGGKHKAVAAAEALKKIFPGVVAKSVDLSVPMPGHVIGDSFRADVKKAYEDLVELVKSHDVIFLLMDSRESRWLPTVLGAKFGKLVINAALGFDSFLVMRHGTRDAGSLELEKDKYPMQSTVPGNRLGCYFCNDVVAPGNSTRDRTLDQQCTVTRPGVSFQAAALAVELMISTLQHPSGALAPASISTTSEPRSSDDSLESLLGIVPHSIRGSLHNFQQFLPTTPLFPNCTACSQKVLEGVDQSGFAFLEEASNNASFLEDLTGLTKLMEESNIAEMLEFSDDDSMSIKSLEAA